MTRITQQQLESYLWGAAVLLRGTIDAGDYKQFIFPLLFYKRLCDVFDEETATALRHSGGDENFAMFPENHRFQIPADAHWREIRKVSRDAGRALQQAMRGIETANPKKLFGIFGDAQWTNKDRLSDAMLRDLIEHFSELELTVANLPEDELGQGYEYLIKKFADDSGHTAAEFYTNRTVVHLMTEMLDVQPGESVYDPTCGSGGMLLSCIAHLRRAGKEWRNVKLYGQERNLMTSSIARMNCFLHGIEDFRIERGDTLAEPKLVEGDRLQRFDVVLANPPYSIKQWNREAFAADPWGRNLYGTPPPGRADYAFWQHILQSLKPKTGRCAILFPHGVLFRQEEADMRRKVVEADLIECVLGLGPNLFYNSPMEACVVICRTAKPKARKGRILLINAINEVTRERAQSFLTDDHIEHIVQAYEKFADAPGFARVVTLEEVRVKECNLSIPLYIASAATGNAHAVSAKGDLAGSLDQWRQFSAAVGRSLAELLPKLNVPNGKRKANPEWAKLPLFNRKNWSRVRFGDVVRQLKEETDPVADGVQRYVAGEHMETENVHIRKWGNVGDGYLGPAFIRRFRKGQVLYGSRRTYLKKVAVAEWDGVTANTTFVVEPVEGMLLSELLPWLMLSEKFTRHSVQESKGSTNPYINFPDIAKFEFDLPPLDQQRGLAEILWAVDEVIQKTKTLQSSIESARSATVEEHFSRSLEQKSNFQRIEAVAKVSYGITLGAYRKTLPIQRPYLRVANLQRNAFDLTEVKTINCKETEIARYELADGDVLIVEGHATVSEIGRAAVWRSAKPGMLHQNHLIRARCSDGLIAEYLSLCINARLGQDYFRSRAKSSSGLNTINSTVVKEFLLPKTPVQSQENLIAHIDQFDGSLRGISTNQCSLQRLLEQLLNTLFT